MLQVFGDEYTEYLTKNEYEDLIVSVLGNYVGIGIYMAQTTDGNIIILFPIEGSPAEEAGLQSGDIIAKINGEDCSDMTIDKASNKIKGEKGTEGQGFPGKAKREADGEAAGRPGRRGVEH